MERRPNKALIPVPMADVDFGIELELSTSTYTSSGDVVDLIESNAGVDVADMTHDYTAACNRNDIWVLMTDASLQCSVARPDVEDCNKFEIKSPILRGGAGVGEIDRVVRAMGNISSIKVNSSMGFHVHVNVSQLSTFDLIKVCQNFVKYEAAMDSLMPPSRRNGNIFCQSNRLAVASGSLGASNGEIHQMLAYCESVQELGNLMSPDKYYKLNMGPLVTGRQPTIEFRQHSSTYNKDKVKSWIRFCVAFVHNSAKFRAPSYLGRSNVSNDELFEMLMVYVVKDRFLRDFYRQRRVDVDHQSDNCCSGCASGEGSCETNFNPRKKSRY